MPNLVASLKITEYEIVTNKLCLHHFNFMCFKQRHRNIENSKAFVNIIIIVVIVLDSISH